MRSGLRTILIGVCASVCLCLVSGDAVAQCPSRTTVSDTLFNADGTLAAGRVVIAWPTFLIGSCQVIAGQTSVNVSGGIFSVQLYPNLTAVPAGTSYRVTYYLKSGQISTEYWVVPSSTTPVTLASVRSASVPALTMMFSQSQITGLFSTLAKKVELPTPCASGKFLRSNGSSGQPQVDCVDGTGSGSNHSLLSPTHSDTTTATVLRGDLITGLGVSPSWQRLTHPAVSDRYLKSNTNEVIWSSGAAAGTGSCINQFIRGLNSDAAPTCASVGGTDFASQSANVVLAGPSSGVAAAPSFRALIDADVPPEITRDAEWPSATATLTNKTLDVEGVGNVITTVSYVALMAASCQNATATLLWDTPTTNPAVAACITGTNTQKGVADFADGAAAISMQMTWPLPRDWTGAVDARFKWLTTATTGNVVWQIATVCVADAETDDPAFNAASTVTDAAKATANQTNDADITGVTMTGCAAGELLHLKVLRDPAHASDTLAAVARLISVELTSRRAQ